MENENKTKVRVKHPDRVSVLPEALTRLEDWISELETSLKGIRITKGDLVNFLIMSHNGNLSEKETTQLKGQFFDNVRHAEWALRQIKAAKAIGKNLSLAEIMRSDESGIAKPK